MRNARNEWNGWKLPRCSGNLVHFGREAPRARRELTRCGAFNLTTYCECSSLVSGSSAAVQMVGEAYELQELVSDPATNSGMVNVVGYKFWCWIVAAASLPTPWCRRAVCLLRCSTSKHSTSELCTIFWWLRIHLYAKLVGKCNCTDREESHILDKGGLKSYAAHFFSWAICVISLSWGQRAGVDRSASSELLDGAFDVPARANGDTRRAVPGSVLMIKWREGFTLCTLAFIASWQDDFTLHFTLCQNRFHCLQLAQHAATVIFKQIG